MSKKNETAENKPATVTVDASRFAQGAKKITSITEKWFGINPNEIQAGLTSEELGQVDINEIVGREITVLGYKERTGKIKGKETQYLVIMYVATGESAPAVFITGSGVIMKKLSQANAENALPVTGTIHLKEGADFNYFDFN